MFIPILFSFFLNLPLFSQSMESGKGNDFDKLYAGTAKSLTSTLSKSFLDDDNYNNFANEDKPVPPEMLPASGDSYAVPYIVRGYVRKDSDTRYFLDTLDGRSFRLLADYESTFTLIRKAAEKSKLIKIEGWAHRADDLGSMRVKQVLPPEYGKEFPEEPLDPIQHMSGTFLDAGDSIGLSSVRFGHTENGASFDWKKVVVHPSLVDKIYMIKRPFNSWNLAHVVMLYTFKDGGLADLEGNNRKGLVLSVEPMILKDMEMGFVNSVSNEFPIVWNLSTWEEYVSCMAEGIKRTTYEGTTLIPYELNLTPEQKIKLVAESLRHAGMNRRGEFYHLITNNCVITHVVMLNRVLPEGKKLRLYFNPNIYDFSSFHPNVFFDDLAKRGLGAATNLTIDPSNYKTFLTGF